MQKSKIKMQNLGKIIPVAGGDLHIFYFLFFIFYFDRA